MRKALSVSSAPKVAVSPIVGGRALKGPADKMLTSLGHESSATGVSRMYEGLVDGMVIDQVDSGEATGIEELGIRVLTAEAIMSDAEDRTRLARETLEFAETLARR